MRRWFGRGQAAVDRFSRAYICLLGLAILFSAASARASGLPTQPEKTKPSAVSNPLMLKPLDELTATRKRPLFAPTRRPPPPPAPVASNPDPSPQPVAPPSLLLVGTVQNTDGATAIVRQKSSDKILRVQAGDSVDGWSVARVEERALVMQLDGRSATFALFNGGQQPTEDHLVAARRPPPVVELNAAGILTAHRVRTVHR